MVFKKTQINPINICNNLSIRFYSHIMKWVEILLINFCSIWDCFFRLFSEGKISTTHPSLFNFISGQMKGEYWILDPHFRLPRTGQKDHLIELHIPPFQMKPNPRKYQILILPNCPQNELNFLKRNFFKLAHIIMWPNSTYFNRNSMCLTFWTLNLIKNFKWMIVDAIPSRWEKLSTQ